MDGRGRGFPSKMLGRGGALLVVLALALFAQGAFAGALAARSHTVTLMNFQFHPRNLSIRRGDSVKWVWRDQTEHNVTFHGFHSRNQVSGSYSVRFTRSGTFNYRCTFHAAEGMRGKVVVH